MAGILDVVYEKVHLSAGCDIYVVLGEMLWRVREYEKCILYTRKAIELLPTLDRSRVKAYDIFCYNTMGLAFHRMGQYDSAFLYYRKGLNVASNSNNAVWEGIFSGNMAQIYFVQGKYTTALPLFKLDYETSSKRGLYDNAANSLQWAARTNLVLSKTNIALSQVREAFTLLQKWPSRNYLQNIYFAAAEIFKVLKISDSSFYYSGLYYTLHDSLEREIYQSSISISKLRLNDEKDKYSVLNLEHEKQVQEQQRNLIIGVILFLATIALLLINRQRLKLKYRQQLLERDKMKAEQEVESARTQLKMFMQNVVEKTNLIEKLEQQVKANEDNFYEQQLTEELFNQTILTEDNWLKFKMLFEKTHPGFFMKLKKQVAEITLAEQRMAALTRLHLTTKQMAGMLGISPNSVIKTKQRLRQRFNLETYFQVKDFLSKL
jgi:DNA-binding CsgD family transcriptional regulator